MASLQPVTYDLWIPLLAKLTCCLWAAVRWGLNSCSGVGKQAPEQAVLQGTLCPEFQLLWQPLDPSWLLLKAMIMNIVSTSWFLFFFNTEIFTTHLFHNHIYGNNLEHQDVKRIIHDIYFLQNTVFVLIK